MRDSSTWRKCSGSCACTSIAGPRQVEVVQARKPETQRRRAQHRRPCLALQRGERAHARGTPRAARRRSLASRRMVLGQAPVVRAHRDVVEQAVDAREVEVDHAARCVRPRTARCRGKDRRAPGRAAGPESGARPGRRARSSSSFCMLASAGNRTTSCAAKRHHFGPRGFSRYALYERPARCMRPEQRAQLRAMRRLGALDGAAAEARDQRRGLAVERAEVLVGKVRDRRRARNAVAREVRHQVEVERQLVRRQALEQREHVAPLRGGDEVVGVLDARLDRLAADQSRRPSNPRASCRAQLPRLGCKPTEVEAPSRRCGLATCGTRTPSSSESRRIQLPLPVVSTR